MSLGIHADWHRDRLFKQQLSQASPHWAHPVLLEDKGGNHHWKKTLFSFPLPLLFFLPQRSLNSHLHGAPLHLPAITVINQGEGQRQKSISCSPTFAPRLRMNGGGGDWCRRGEIYVYVCFVGHWVNIAYSCRIYLLLVDLKCYNSGCMYVCQYLDAWSYEKPVLYSSKYTHTQYTYTASPHPNPSSLLYRRLGLCVASDQLVARISMCSCLLW